MQLIKFSLSIVLPATLIFPRLSNNKFSAFKSPSRKSLNYRIRLKLFFTLTMYLREEKMSINRCLFEVFLLDRLTIFFEWMYSTAKTSCRNFSRAFASVNLFWRISRSEVTRRNKKISCLFAWSNFLYRAILHWQHIQWLNKSNFLIPLPERQIMFSYANEDDRPSTMKQIFTS